MHSRTDNEHLWYHQCECCPYGYHIDLDFVRYCESIGQQVERTASIKRRKDRRRQRQSIEVLLGLESPAIVSQKESTLPPIRDIEKSPVIHDALNDAVSDFERTLQRSKNKLSNNLPDVTAVSAHSHRGTIFLSMSSSGTNSPSMTILQSAGDGPVVRDFDTISIESCGLSPAALQNIREQMALSLERTKELEEKVKIIPSLQAQLAALKEENRRLKLQLHAEENAKLNKLNSNHLLNQFTCSRNRSQSFSNIDSVDNVDKKQPPAPPPRRDFGVMAGVLTRNVGVGHQTPHTKTVSTATQSEQHVDRWYLEKTKFLTSAHLPPSSKGTQTIFSKEKRDVCIQTKIIPTTNEICTQTLTKKIQLVDSAVTARIPVCNAYTQCAVNMITIGISDDTTADPPCLKCNVKRSTVGIDTSDVLKECMLQPISLAALSVPRSKSFHLGEEKLNHPRSKTIGCQYENNYRAHKSSQSEIRSTSKHTQHEILHTNKAVQYENMVQTKSTDTGGLGPVMQNQFTECFENKVPTSDASCNTTKDSPCGKCAKESEEVLKKPDADTPSRIPRLQPPTTPVENRKLRRLDTYTKIPAEKSPVGLSALELVLPKAITTEVSSFEKVKQKYKLPEVVKGTHNGKSEEDKDVIAEPTVSENALCQPPSPRKKCVPSREMQAAMKVLNDSLKKSHGRDARPQMKNANALVENEWFKISSTIHADPMDVEDYLDCFEDISSSLLEHIVNMVDASGNTAMHYAVSHGNFDVVSILLDSKVCDINKQNKAGYTSVMLVSLADMCSQTHASVVRRLFLLADVNIRAKQHGQTALMLAVSHGRLDMVSMLLEAGADINIQDEDGSTALMCAAEHGHVDIVKHFLSQPDCDSSISDVDGSTALKIAMEAGHRHIGVLLYAHERNIHGNMPARPKKSKSTSASPKTPSSPLMQRSANRALSTSK